MTKHIEQAQHRAQSGRESFERIVALLDYPMFVVTTRCGDDRAGCLVGFTSQVSIRPSRFLVGLSKRNHTFRTADRGATHLAVHLLTREHRALARLFGGGSLTDLVTFSDVKELERGHEA